MPEAITTLATVWSLISFANAVHNDEMDVYINGKQVAETTPAQIIQKGEERREQILLAAQEHRDRILLDHNQRILSQTNL